LMRLNEMRPSFCPACPSWSYDVCPAWHEVSLSMILVRHIHFPQCDRMDHHHHNLPVSVRATVAFIIFTKWLLLCSPPPSVILLIILRLECFRLLTPQTRNWTGFNKTTFRPLHQECNEGAFQLLTLFSFASVNVIEINVYLQRELVFVDAYNGSCGIVLFPY
jgi:hypothetical protein